MPHRDIGLGGFNDDVINVHLDFMTELFLQEGLHAPLIGGFNVLPAERHRHIAIDPMGVMNAIFSSSSTFSRIWLYPD
jgi:hypothetical protein